MKVRWRRRVSERDGREDERAVRAAHDLSLISCCHHSIKVAVVV